VHLWLDCLYEQGRQRGANHHGEEEHYNAQDKFGNPRDNTSDHDNPQPGDLYPVADQYPGSGLSSPGRPLAFRPILTDGLAFTGLINCDTLHNKCQAFFTGPACLDRCPLLGSLEFLDLSGKSGGNIRDYAKYGGIKGFLEQFEGALKVSSGLEFFGCRDTFRSQKLTIRRAVKYFKTHVII
jgi:hypothetical protein